MPLDYTPAVAGRLAECWREFVAMHVRMYLAGRVCIEGGGVLLDERRFQGRQGRLVFAYLAAEHRRAVSRDELADELWGDALPPTWERTLSAIVSKLRALVGSIGLPGSALTSAFGCYQLYLPPGSWIDLEAAAEAVDFAESALRDGEPRRAWGWGQVTFQVARRPFLAGEEGPWATRRRGELHDVLLRALDCLSDVCLWNAEPALAARHAEEAITLDPFRETSYQRLMRAHAATGNRAQALRVYERCRRVLSEHLGVPPSPQTEAAYLEILRA